MAKTQKEGRPAKKASARARRSAENQRKGSPAQRRDTAPSQVSQLGAKSQTPGVIAAGGTTVNNNATVNQQIFVQGDALFSGSPEDRPNQTAAAAAEHTSPGDRDDALSKRAQAKIKALGGQCATPRTAVNTLLARVGGNRATVNVIVSPPRCGKSQLLYDIISRVNDHPLIFVEQLVATETPLTDAVKAFDIQADLSSLPFIQFLKARASEKKPLHVFIDAKAVSDEMLGLVSFIVENPNANAHLFIASTFQVALDLLFRDDYEPRLVPNAAITIFELGAFTDRELGNVYPAADLKLANAPFGRLIRWPGLRSAVRRESSLVGALHSWFRNCPQHINDAMNVLGSELARNSSWSANQLPLNFVQAHSDELKVLRDYGFVVEIPRKRSGLRSYGFSCIEIGLYALLSHVFEFAPRQERASAMDSIVAHWKGTSSEQEMFALATILPAFLTENNGNPLDKIVRYMISISFGSYILETMSRSALFEEFERAVDSHVIASDAMRLTHRPAEVLKRALVAFRTRVGLMPDFAELEQKLGGTLRFFDGAHNEVLKADLPIEQWEDKNILSRFGRTGLLDALYLLSIGNFSWLPPNTNQDTICRVAEAIAELAEPHRRGFPINSRHPYLAKIITRRYPRDLSLILKSNRGSKRRISLKNKHIAYLAGLVIDAYKHRDWEPLADCFAYADMMSGDLLKLLRQEFLENGDIASFASVFINGGERTFPEWPQSIRERVVQRMLDPDCNVAGVVIHLENRSLRIIRDKHPEAFMRLSKRVWEEREPRSILRILSLRPSGSEGDVDANLRTLIAQFDTRSISIAISTREFFDSILSTISIPISSSENLGAPGAEAGPGVELTLEALCLFKLGKEHLVVDEYWTSVLMNRKLEIKTLVRFAPRLEMPNIKWSLERCKMYIGASIREDIKQGRHLELDRILRTALLNIHESQFNGIYVRVAVAMVSEADGEYRKLIARRLILSGFDLWEVPDAGYTCPMLNQLLAEVDGALSVDERDGWVRWMQRHYRWLRKLPLFTTYTMIEFTRVNAAREAFTQLPIEEHIKKTELLLPFVDLALTSRMQNTEEFAAELLEDIEENAEELIEFGKRYPEELKRLRAFLPRPMETTVPQFTDKEVLDAFGRATEVIPRLPTSLGHWDGAAPRRSMLSPVRGDGYQSYTLEEFRSSLTQG